MHLLFIAFHRQYPALWHGLFIADPPVNPSQKEAQIASDCGQ
jgi:hypothetical protein